MSQSTLEARSELRTLVDTFSILADENRTADQVLLLTPDTSLRVYMGGELVLDISGRPQIEEAFTAFAADLKRSVHLNGQHVVDVDGDDATGIAYCRVTHVSEEDGHEVITDHSVRYDDEYVRRDGRWSISARVARFVVMDRRTPQH